MPTTSTSSPSSAFPTTSARTVDGVTQIDLNFATAMAKGSGTIFVTDGAVQTVIDRVTGEPKLRVVGATFTREISLDQVSISGTHVTFDAAGLPPGATLNVYMGAGTLLGGGKALGAITVPGSAAFATPAGEPPGDLSASIAVENKTLKAGADIQVTVSFSKAVSTLDIEAITAQHAGVKELSHSTDMRTWTITLSATDSVESLSNVLRLDMGQVSAADGTRGSGILSSAPYAVDTIVDAYVFPYLGVNDEGPSYEDGVTKDNAQFISGLLMGEPAPDEHIELVINGRTVDKALIRLIDYEDGWYWYYDPEQEPGVTPTFDEGNNTVSVRLVKADGHSSAGYTRTIVIDTDTPDIVARPTTPVDASQAITIGFDEAMYLSGNSEVIDQIEVVDEFGNTSWIDLSDSMFSPDRKTLKISAEDHNLATGNSYYFYLPYGLTDLAGNEYEGEQIAFTTAGPFQDKAPPRLVQAYIVNGNGSYKAGDVLEFRLRYTEKVNLDAGTEPVLYLEGGMEAEYFGLANDGREMVFKYTVKAGDNHEYLDDVYHDNALLGNVRDDFGNVFDRAHVEYDGLSTADGYGAQVSIDTEVAAPGAPQLHADSEATAPGAGTTADARPRLIGSGAEAYASISIYAGDVKVGAATADHEGRWDTVLTGPLSGGAHELKVSQEDRAGNVSAQSTALSLTVSASAPASLATPVLDRASDTGISDDDGITMADQPTIGGTGPAGTTLRLKHNGAEIATVDTDASGNWDYTLPALADGMHSFTVQQGDSGPVSAALTITVDGTNPAVLGWDEAVANFNVNGDLVITFSEAIHIAAAEGDSDMVWLIDGDDHVQKIAVGGANLSSDKRTLTISSAEHDLRPLSSYRVQLPSTLTDLAGNSIGEYEIHFSTGNDALPGAVRAIVVGDGSYRAGETVTIRVRFNEQVEKWGGSGLSLGLSNNLRADFTGMSGVGNDEALFSFTVAPGNDYTDVRITDTSELVGRFADLSGNLLDAAHISLTALYNSSGYGGRIDIDTVAPATPALPQLDGDSNSGSDDDLLTNDRTPRLAGSGAEAGTKVEIYENGALLGYGTVDEDGDWSASVDAAHALDDGVHQLVVKLVDRAGNSSAASAPLALTIDGSVSALDTPRLATGHDTGSSGSDKLTNEGRPTLVGSGAEAGARIKILSGDAVVGFGDADGSGNWSATLFAVEGGLPDGTYSFTATQEDRAGNLSAASPALVFTVDRSPPDAPGAPRLAAGSDTGVSNSDGITSNRTPTITGSGAVANAEVALYANEVEVGRTTADASGAWSISIGAGKLGADKSYSIAATQFDAAGNESGYSGSFNLVLDTTAPATALAAPDLDAGSDSGSSSTDNITNDTTPTFSGSGALAGGEVVLLVGSSEVGRVTADASGNWSITSSVLPNGTHQVRVHQFDLAGNKGPDSDPLSVRIDTVGPSLTDLDGSFFGSRFDLTFNEAIRFHPSGRFDLQGAVSSKVYEAGDGGNGWQINGGNVLSFNISLIGLLRMQNNAVTDLAGNAAVIEVPWWDLSLF